MAGLTISLGRFAALDKPAAWCENPVNPGRAGFGVAGWYRKMTLKMLGSHGQIRHNVE